MNQPIPSSWPLLGLSRTVIAVALSGLFIVSLLLLVYVVFQTGHDTAIEERVVKARKEATYEINQMRQQMEHNHALMQATIDNLNEVILAQRAGLDFRDSILLTRLHYQPPSLQLPDNWYGDTIFQSSPHLILH